MSSLMDDPKTTVYHVEKGDKGALLKIADFNLWYGKSQALFDVNMDIER